MKKLLLVLMIGMMGVKGYGQMGFQKLFEGDVFGYGNCAHQTNDGGYIILGDLIGYGTLLIKTDSTGDTLWTHTYKDYFCYDVKQTIDNGYVFVGSWGNDMCLIKTNSLGDTIWSKIYGLPSNYFPVGIAVLQTNDGGYVIVGFTDNNPTVNNSSVYFIKTNSFGDTLVTRKYHASNTGFNDYGYSVQQTSDGGFIMVGYTQLENPYGAYLIKLKANFDTAWTKSYGGPLGISGNYVQQTNDGGYIFTGYYNDSTGAFALLIKTDSLGDTLFTKTYGGSGVDRGYSVLQTIDGGYILTGTTNFGAGGIDIYLIKTDSFGDTLWTRAFGNTGYEYAGSIQQTNDGGYIIGGTTHSYGNSYNIYLIKTDAEGNGGGCNQHKTATIVGSPSIQIVRPHTIVTAGVIVSSQPIIIGSGDSISTLCFTTGINNVNVPQEISLYPNPTSGTFTISYNQSGNSNYELGIYDVLGQEVYHQAIINQESTFINLPQISNGVYFYQLSNSKETWRGKFVVEK